MRRLFELRRLLNAFCAGKKKLWKILGWMARRENQEFENYGRLEQACAEGARKDAGVECRLETVEYKGM